MSLLSGSIYVDDSGNPGADSGSDYLSASRKSWTAVIVPSSVAAATNMAMRIFLDGVLSEFGADELHFTEIFSGQGIWKKVPVARRAELISIMGDMMRKLSLPIVHQTVSDETLLDHPALRETLQALQVTDWNLKDGHHVGLLMLCYQVARCVREMHRDKPENVRLPMPMVADEGLSPAGGSRRLPNWADVIEGPAVSFRRSVDVPGIQLADFAAFTIMRSQWIAARRTTGTELSQADAVMLRAAARLNVLNLSMRSLDPRELGKKSYERWLADDRTSKGLPPRPPSGD